MSSKLNMNYFDLTEDIETTNYIKELSKNTTKVMAPQCGLAPGLIGIIGNNLACEFDKLRDIELRVGALPRYPNGQLAYSFTWSPEGVINEFEPVEDKTGNILMSLNRKKLKNLVDNNGIKAGLGDLGSVLFMHCNLVHGSSENISPYSRTLFYVNVSSIENPQTTFSRKDFHAGRDFTPIVTVNDNSLEI